MGGPEEIRLRERRQGKGWGQGRVGFSGKMAASSQNRHTASLLGAGLSHYEERAGACEACAVNDFHGFTSDQMVAARRFESGGGSALGVEDCGVGAGVLSGDADGYGVGGGFV
jgi:hypothetical protein